MFKRGVTKYHLFSILAALLVGVYFFSSFSPLQLSPESSDLCPRDNAIEISSFEQLNEIHSNPDANYVLTNDIDAEGFEWIPLGTAENPFNGRIDGNGYTIKGLSYETNFDNKEFVRFFGDCGTIVNVNFVD